MRRDGPAERPVAERIAVAQQRARAAQVSHREPRPERRRKILQRRHAVPKGPHGPLRPHRAQAPGGDERRTALAHGARRHHGGPLSGARGPARRLGHRVDHIGTGAHPAPQIALRAQLVEGELDGVARDGELRGKRACGGQPRAGGETAGEDGVAQAAVQLAEERLAGGGIERHQHRRRAGGAAGLAGATTGGAWTGGRHRSPRRKWHHHYRTKWHF
jgi:hypothetical protein